MTVLREVHWTDIEQLARLERELFADDAWSRIWAINVQSHVYAARALLLDTARKRDEGVDVTMEASMCKLFASEMCGRVADRAVQVVI